MNRPTKNRLRGNQRAPIPDVPPVGTPYLLSQYNGRANYAAGQYDIRAVKPLQPDGLIANWMGNKPAGS